MKNNEFEFVKKVVKGCIYFVVGLFVLGFILGSCSILIN